MALIATIDGARGTGKTSVACETVAWLQARGLSAVYFKKGLRDPISELENTVAHYKVLSLHGADIVVVDRMAPTELAMSFALHRESPRSLEAYGAIVTDIEEALGAVTVILRAETEVLKERLERRGTRGVDLPWELVQPAWDYAKSQLPDAFEWTVNKGEDYDALFHWLVPFVVDRVKAQGGEPPRLTSSVSMALLEKRQ